MSEELDHQGADFQVKYKNHILNYQVKKETQSREVRREKKTKKVIQGTFIDINYEVPNFDTIQNPKKKNGELKNPMSTLWKHIVRIYKFYLMVLSYLLRSCLKKKRKNRYQIKVALSVFVLPLSFLPQVCSSPCLVQIQQSYTHFLLQIHIYNHCQQMELRRYYLHSSPP